MADTGSTPLKYSNGAPQEMPLPITLFDSVMDKVRDWVDNTSPGAVKRAGDYYVAAHDLLQDAAVTLKQKAVELAAQYQGPESVAAQKELQRLHASIRELAGKMNEVGVPLRKYAETLTWAQQNIVTKRGEDSRSDHDTDWADNIPFYGMYRVERRARDRFNEINEKIVQHYQELPSEVQHSLPTPMQIEIPDYRNVDLPSGPGGLPGGTGGDAFTPTRLDVNGPGANDLGLNGLDPDGFDPNGAGPGVIGGLPSDPTGTGQNGSGQGGWNPNGSGANGLPGGLGPNSVDGSLPGLDATALSGPGSGETVLAGLNDHGLTGPQNGLGNGPSFGNTLNGNPLNGSGVGPPNGTGQGGLGPVSGVFGPGGGPGKGLGAGQVRAGGSPMMPFVPPGGGAGAKENQDRENSTWLMEDDEVWGNGGDTIPPVIA
ncbi:hypothetical protein [Streptosporangium carneum]|uniref:PPE family domain-containing protein n=1 Tax=Streptosporangium carneum TaxID=47481 RepID=A0A9W6MGD1_9ACTN|nr:hypothetical protein [Streptosporangium carneum]GLK13599.1 hypothetical protein GCM10017600_70100 [Streptosporangium carneum]